jgi:O-antigen/teichoic acid export membrane protein
MRKNLGELNRQLATMSSSVAINFVVNMLQGILLARLLGLEDYGRYATLLAFALLVARLNDFGLPHAFTYFYRRSPGTLSALLRLLAYNTLWCIFVALTIILAMANDMLPFLDVGTQPDSALLISYAVFLVAGTPATILLSTLMASGNYRVFATMNSFGTVMQTVLIAALGVTGLVTLTNFIAIAALIQVLVTGVMLAYLWRRSRETAAEAIRTWEVYSFGLRLQWGIIMKLVSTRLELLIVAAILPPAQVGIYSLALSIRDAGLVPQSIYTAPLQNMIIDRNSGKEQTSDRNMVLLSLVLQIAVSVIMSIGAALVLPFVIPVLYGQVYAAAIIPSIVLFASIIFLGAASICWIVYNGKGRPELTSAVLTVSGIAGPLIVFALTHLYGLTGASVASLLIAALTFGVSFGVIVHLQKYTFADVGDALVRMPMFATTMVRAALGGLKS